MSQPGASYAFVSWLRRGLSAVVTGLTADADDRVSVPIVVDFGEGRQASTTLPLVGPAEIIGLDPRLVVRTWPRSDTTDAEPNYFPMVELHAPDLPWRYAPAGAGADDRLQPWLCLVVLREDEIADELPAGGARPLPAVVVSDAPLPRLDQAWAWAHGQVVGEQMVNPDEARRLLAQEPHRLVSRLLCPRRLDPQTPYAAVLVPAYEGGRRAGLGLPPADDVDPTAPAWETGARASQLPVYYRWRFTTGLASDFEELVKRIEPAELPASIGRREMSVRNEGTALPPAAQGPLGLEGALRALATETTPWPDAEREPFVEALRGLLNRQADLLVDGEGVRSVAPPLYGQWHAGQARVEPGAPPVWFQEANSDPRLRVAAGLGTQVVQANQRQLVAGAWRQAQGLADVNDTLKVVQFAREIALRVHARHLAIDDDDLVLQLTAPVHGRVLASTVTVAARLHDSPVAEGAAGSTWRRVVRPMGPIGRRQGRPAGDRPRVVARTNDGSLSAAPPVPTPSDMATPSRAGQGLVPGWVSAWVVAVLRLLSRLLLSIAGVLLAVALAIGLVGGPVALVVVLGVLGVAALLLDRPLRRLVGRFEAGRAIRDGDLISGLVLAGPPRPGFAAVESELVGGEPTPTAGGQGGADSPSARAFRAAAAAMLDSTAATTVPGIPLRSLELARVRETVIAALDPHATVAARVRQHLAVADGVWWRPADPLEPVLVGPDFPQPMYRYLAEQSLDSVLPGVAEVPHNSVSVVVTNQRFVEAYLLGLNHEMGRELLWREYPTDQRRTFFRQFWDTRGFVPGTGQVTDPERLKDIRPIHLWDPSAALGGNGARDETTAEQLVLLIRGDVIYRYPDLIVYVARAVLDAETGEREPGAEEQHPVFGGTLGPDIAFFGFGLGREQVRGSGNDPGWFFVLQEQPTEPRFGLDAHGLGAPPPETWNDLHWGHLVAPGSELTTVDYIDLDTELPDTTLINDPPGVAWHARDGATASQLAFATLQRPVRVAVHATRLVRA